MASTPKDVVMYTKEAKEAESLPKKKRLYATILTIINHSRFEGRKNIINKLTEEDKTIFNKKDKKLEPTVVLGYQDEEKVNKIGGILEEYI